MFSLPFPLKVTLWFFFFFFFFLNKSNSLVANNNKVYSVIPLH
jgi:hypothetical protein